jgi:hypothetical protein
MEVSDSSWRIEKFSGRPGTNSLREFKAVFSTMVCELKLKYGINYTEESTFKKLAYYVHYGALDVYEQHFTSLCHSHHHCLSSCTISYHYTSWDYA